MQILILTKQYPKPESSMWDSSFIHVRSLYYAQHGFQVTVLCFSCSVGYQIDGIKVISPQEYMKRPSRFDILASHASNIRNHYRFIKRFENNFTHIVFFFHGHEIVRVADVYPPPYSFVKKSGALPKAARDLYDTFKLKLWHDYLIKLEPKAELVFVSNWLYNKFLLYTKIDPNLFADKVHIINNSVGKTFETYTYDLECNKEYDFITIRSDMDGSKYGADIVTGLALNNPGFKFLFIGKGNYFNFNQIPHNLTWQNKTLKHEEMLDYLNISRCALMPTRQDTQGVMSCEMMTYGIPLITSDIDINYEIFGGFPQVRFIDNLNTNIDLTPILNDLTAGLPYNKPQKYFADAVTGSEIKLFQSFLGN
jgi:hypothetical protein